MNFERELVISILKLAKNYSISKQLLQKTVNISTELLEKLLRKYEKSGFLYQRRGFIEAGEEQRMALAVYALKLGIDVEEICRFLDWSEFEQVAVLAFRTNGYVVLKNFRFKWASRKWEIDVLGLKQPIIACVDCKHWSRGWRRAAAIKTVEEQIERAKAFAESIESHVRQMPQILEWRKILVTPIVISLTPSPFKFHQNVPLVPILKLQNFLTKLLAHIHEIKTFQAKLMNKRFNL